MPQMGIRVRSSITRKRLKSWPDIIFAVLSRGFSAVVAGWSESSQIVRFRLLSLCLIKSRNADALRYKYSDAQLSNSATINKAARVHIQSRARRRSQASVHRPIQQTSYFRKARHIFPISRQKLPFLAQNMRSQPCPIT